MSDNEPSASHPPAQTWPPNHSVHKRRSTLSTEELHDTSPHTPSRPQSCINLSFSLDTPVTPSPSNATSKAVKYQNGYAVSPKPRQSLPYSLPRKGRKRSNPFDFPVDNSVLAHSPLSFEEWQALVQTFYLVPPGCTLRDFQIECANYVLSRKSDVCVIAPTGMGKSLLWCLPLLVAKSSISLVVTPYTSLGREMEESMQKLGFSSIFIHEDQNSEDVFESTAKGNYRIVFVCVEMLESSRFARVLFCKRFQALLGGVYFDEAHLFHEAHDYRDSYTFVHLLRKVIGETVPFIGISATLPTSYRTSLFSYAGFRTHSTHLINLGCYRPELSSVVLPLKHDPSSFRDLTCVIPLGTQANQIPQTIIYCDDLELLTKMFWWFKARLSSMGLSSTLVDILHSGLSSAHEERALNDFREGKTRILLGSEKIGAGMNFPRVERVYQYTTRNGLSVPKFVQRRGRGARTHGMIAVGYLLFEPELLDTTKEHPHIDKDILRLVRTDGCYEDIIDLSLENPPRNSSSNHQCCSHCFPSLIPFNDLEFVMLEATDFASSSSNTSLTKDEKMKILEKLIERRKSTWESDWRTEWPDYGPKDLISDADLEQVAKKAMSISHIDDLFPLTHLPYWSEFAPWLLKTVQEVVHEVFPNLNKENTAEQIVRTVEDNTDDIVGTLDGSQRKSKAKAKSEQLHPMEFILNF
ncbi:hypothetical protein ABKN59_010550 [Abortiporus biennis]